MNAALKLPEISSDVYTASSGVNSVTSGTSICVFTSLSITSSFSSGILPVNKPHPVSIDVLKRIAKTLSFLVEENPILVVAAGDAKIDNKKYRTFFNAKAKMISFEDVEKYIGHNVGGVCPFGINSNVKVYLDDSLKRFSTVFPACGSSNSAIELTNDELEKYSSNFVSWVDVCKLPE